MQLFNLFKNKQTNLNFLYQQFFNLSPTPTLLCAPETFQILHTNEAACALYGYEPAELLKMTLRQLHDPSSSLSPHTATQSISRIRHKKKDGSLVTIHQTRHDLTEQDAHYHLFIMQDIDAESRLTTQLKNTLEIKEQTLSYLESLLQHSPFAFAIFDQNLNFIQVNTRFAALSGKKHQTYVGQSIKYALRLCEPFELHLKHALATSRPTALFDHPIQFQSAHSSLDSSSTETSNQTHTFEYGTAYCLPIFNQDRKTIGVTLLLTDTTEKNKALLLLKETIEINENWSRLIHQDFKLPLSVARFNAEVIEKKKPSLGQIPSIGKKITESIDRIYQMIEIATARHPSTSPTLNRQSFKQQNTPIYPLMTSIIQDMNHLHGNRFSIEPQDPCATEKIVGFWSPEYLKQAIETLMSHTTSYSPPDSTIQINVQPDTVDPKWIHISFQNPSTNLSEIEQTLFFESSSDSASTGLTKGKNSNNNFGLNFVKSITESHGGRLSFKSTPAAGTTITLSLPKA